MDSERVTFSRCPGRVGRVEGLEGGEDPRKEGRASAGRGDACSPETGGGQGGGRRCEF